MAIPTLHPSQNDPVFNGARYGVSAIVREFFAAKFGPDAVRTSLHGNAITIRNSRKVVGRMPRPWCWSWSDSAVVWFADHDRLEVSVWGRRVGTVYTYDPSFPEQLESLLDQWKPNRRAPRGVQAGRLTKR